MQSFQIYTMFVNGSELLYHALGCLGQWQSHAVVLDNSPRQDLVIDGFCGEIYRPSVPLSCSQSYNLILSLARQRRQSMFFIMHSDAQASPQVIEEMLFRGQALSQTGTRWGVMFSNYDVLCLHNTEALAGFRWDQHLPLSYTDVDFYRRLRLSGLEIVESGLTVGHMNEGSSSLKQDAILNCYVQINYSAWAEYYVAKWGGNRDQEIFLTPFNLGDASLLKG